MHTIVEGVGNLPDIISRYGARKLFLVAGSSYRRLAVKSVVDSLNVAGVVEFSEFTPNPRFEEVCKGAERFLASGCDMILAIGGGSAIDVAKCIKLAVLAPQGCNAVIPPYVSQHIPIAGASIPFIAIPTTAGTGSESTHNAVMYYNGFKQTVVNDDLLPDYAILDHSTLTSLPLYQKKCTMLDALCQGIESWWSVNSTDESKEYSRKCVSLIVENWRRYLSDCDDEVARQIMLAANYSGRAINITQTTAPHAMSYKITSLYNVPHGHAVALSLPWVWQYMLDCSHLCIDNRGKDHLEQVFAGIASALGTETPADGIRCIREMLSEMDIQYPVSVNREADVSILTDSVNVDRLKNNPVLLDKESIRALYGQIVK